MKHLRFIAAKQRANATYRGDDWVILESNAEWFVSGALPNLRLLQRALPPGCSSMRGDRLRLQFINEVGRFTVPGLGVLDLCSYKCGEDHFNSMLADISGIAATLPFAPRLGAGAAHHHDRWAVDAPKYHAFVYLRQILSPAAPADERLVAAVTAILAEPHERLIASDHLVPTSAARDLSERALRQLITGRGSWQRGRTEQPGPWQRISGGAVPVTVRERSTVRSHDTAENRFVKHFLVQARSLVTEIRAQTACLADNERFARRINDDSAMMLQQLDELLRIPLWCAVGALHQVPLGSVALQQRRGYSDILRHDTRLRCLAEVAALTDLWRDLMAIKHISRLYEVWCFFMVVKALSARLGPPRDALVTTPRGYDAILTPGLAVTWAVGVQALYNTSFHGPGRTDAHGSYSVKLIPDVCVVVPRGPIPGLFVFDAKFALDPEADEAKSRDLHVMHVYRDALRMNHGATESLRVRSAWVLFPGTRKGAMAWPAEPPSPATSAGIGSIPLLPAPRQGRADVQALTEVLSAITG